jgi:hypothetical protein
MVWTSSGLQREYLFRCYRQVNRGILEYSDQQVALTHTYVPFPLWRVKSPSVPILPCSGCADTEVWCEVALVFRPNNCHVRVQIGQGALCEEQHSGTLGLFHLGTACMENLVAVVVVKVGGCDECG